MRPSISLFYDVYNFIICHLKVANCRILAAELNDTFTLILNLHQKNIYFKNKNAHFFNAYKEKKKILHFRRP